MAPIPVAARTPLLVQAIDGHEGISIKNEVTNKGEAYDKEGNHQVYRADHCLSGFGHPDGAGSGIVRTLYKMT